MLGTVPQRIRPKRHRGHRLLLVLEPIKFHLPLDREVRG